MDRTHPQKSPRHTSPPHRRIHLHRTRHIHKTTDFLIREPSCRQDISKYLKSSNLRTEDKRRLIQIITNRFPVNTFTSKLKKKHQTDATYADVFSRQMEKPWQKEAFQSKQYWIWTISKVSSKGWNFPSVNGELTIGQLWEDNKIDEICTIDALWEAAQDSEMKRTLSPVDKACTTAHDPRKTRQDKVKEPFLRAHPDGIAHHNEKKIWHLLEF